MKRKCNLLLLLIVISVTVSASAKFDVYVLYFKPTDAPDIDREFHDKIMKDIQQYFQSEMTRHGFIDKTFPLELDESGKLIIHIINAKHNSQHYRIIEDGELDIFKDGIEPELPFRFNNQRNGIPRQCASHYNRWIKNEWKLAWRPAFGLLGMVAVGWKCD